MHARSTTFRARPVAIDDGIAFLRDEVMPAAMAMTGCTGLSMMADRRSGRCIATTAWDAADHMRASAGLMAPMRERAAAVMSADPFVEEWEIASVHRAHTSHDGACVRATWMWLEPGMVDHAVDTYRMVTLPRMQDLEGFCSASLFVDRELGRAVSSVTYDSHEAMNRSREAARTVRMGSARDAHAQVLDVAEFDLVLAHLRVREMA
ncbi:MAG TPA: hypothetical protein VIJ00_17805 [Nakamurella sp.]